MGWRIDKTGYCAKGLWNKAGIATISSLYNEKGELVNTKPKTLTEALSIACAAYPGDFLGIQANDDYSTDYDWLELPYESLISFPGTSSKDLIADDIDGYWYYVATYSQTENFDEAKTKYNELCARIKAAAITLKKGATPVKLTEETEEAGNETDFITRQFELPSIAKGPANFAVSVVIKKNSDDLYIVMLVCGDKYSVGNWEDE